VGAIQEAVKEENNGMATEEEFRYGQGIVLTAGKGLEEWVKFTTCFHDRDPCTLCQVIYPPPPYCTFFTRGIEPLNH
jgi:hypothetical protein